MKESELSEFEKTVIRELVAVRGALMALERRTAMLLAKQEGVSVPKIVEEESEMRTQYENLHRKRLLE